MSGYDITIPETLPASVAPDFPQVYETDGILSNGSILLCDFTHPLDTGTPSGALANGNRITNLASEPALDLIGSGTANDLRPYFLTSSLVGTNERTGSGGVHIVPTSGGAVIATAFSGGSATLLNTYLYENRANDFYFSMWGEITKADSTGNDQPISSIFSNSVNQSSNRLFHMGVDTDSSAVDYDHDPTTLNTVGAFFRSISASGWTGTEPPRS